MSEPDEAGYRAIEALDAVLAAPSARLLEVLAEGDEGEGALRRPALEAVAAMALALPAEAAPAALRERLLASLSGDETQRVAPLAAPPAPGPLDPELPALGEATGGNGARAGGAGDSAGARAVPLPRRAPAGRPLGAAPAIARPRRAFRFAPVLALAATLAALLLGGAAAWLWRDLAATRQRLAAAERERAALAGAIAAAETRQEQGAEAARELGTMRQQLAMVTASGTELCALRPPPAAPLAPEARGMLWVAEDHQHWYLRAAGLAPPGPGRVYRLWFLVGDRPVDAGAFELAGDEAVLASPTMPEGTSAAMVTVEPAGTPAERPAGPVVLYGKDFVKL